KNLADLEKLAQNPAALEKHLTQAVDRRSPPPARGAWRQSWIAKAMDRPHMAAADAVAELVSDLGQPGRLRDVGVTRDHFPAIAAGAMQNLHVRANPRPITSTQDVLDILDLAY
ncbi:MAG: iron-containing alcohol dehydrogenase, partial [Rhodospirillaceae bacterium]|nr:iron-containing alcohol dehydrogenase [Rhodospirillaceae bacterium]